MELLASSILLMVYIVGFCAPQNPIDFIHLNLDAIVARQETILQKLDELETNIKTQLQEQETNMKTQLGELETNMKKQQQELETNMKKQQQELETNIKTQLQEQDTNTKTQLRELETNMKKQQQGHVEEIQQCATHQQVDAFKNILFADECALGSHRFSSSATCIDTVSNYMCSCMEGYLGDGITCQDINECESGKHMCHIYATCTNTNGNYTCECIPGYDGNGYTCNDINECESAEHMCHTYATCTNTNGSHTCKCLPGYEGDGYICNDINECDSGDHMCHTYAKCTNTNGNYTCECHPFHNGDGYTCIPSCESPSQVIPGLGCVIPVKERKTWDLAQNDCHRRGGKLLEGIQKEHLLPLKQHFKKYLGSVSSSYEPWVGLRGGVWVKSRDPVPPIWKSGYPAGSDKQKNDCGRISLVATPADLFDWNCSSTRAFLCQLLE